jgi:hypothetical protein
MEELLIIRKLMFDGFMNLNDSLVAWRILYGAPSDKIEIPSVESAEKFKIYCFAKIAIKDPKYNEFQLKFAKSIIKKFETEDIIKYPKI